MRAMRSRLLSTLLVCAGAWALPGAAQAATVREVTVCDALQTALDSSVSGDTVRLMSIDCTGPFVLPAATITFEGIGAAGLRGKGDRALVGQDVGATVIRNLTFSDGAPASGNGGAVRITGLSSPTIEGCRFIDSHVAGAAAGGALSIRQNGATAAGSVTVRDNVFGELGHPNLAVTGLGGAVDLAAVRPLVFSGNQLRSNGAGSGGAAVIIGIDTVLLEGNTFAGNVVTGSGGGALLAALGGKGTLRDNTFAQNTIVSTGAATGVHRGGGLEVEFFPELGPPADGHATFTQSGNRFIGNLIQNDTEARYGAGETVIQLEVTSTNDRYTLNDINGGGGTGAGLSIAGVKGAPGAFDGRNTVVAGNEIERGNGAGITLKPTQAVTDEGLTLHDATVSGNRGGPGIGGGDEDRLTATNSILTGNEGGDVALANATVAFSDACLPGGGTAPGPGNLCADPLLAGAGAGNVHETGASPTIDQGDDARIPAGLAADYEGGPRRTDGNADGVTRVDMGADESPAHEPEPTPTPEPTATPTPSPAPSGGVLGVTVVPPKLKLADVVRFPSTRRCVSRRKFRIRLRTPHGTKITLVSVQVNRKRVKTLRGRRITSVVNLKGLPKGRFKVKITLHTADGRKISGTRRYHTCTKKLRSRRPPPV
jgi:Right handed beta helix region